nr:hypothetical protein CFP56_63889 [Quercus suber]
MVNQILSLQQRHDEKHCSGKSSTAEAHRQYGDWLRANGGSKIGSDKLKPSNSRGFGDYREGGSADQQAQLASDSMDTEVEPMGFPMTIQNTTLPKNTQPGHVGASDTPSVKMSASNLAKGNKRGEFTVKSAYYIASDLVDSVEEGESTSEIALDIIAKGSLHDLELFFAVAWSIWWNRNQAIHEDSGSPPIQAWELAGGVLAEFKAACLCPALSQALPLSRWKAPPSGYFKINTDAAAFDDERCSCIGVVIRDCRGVVLAASSKVLSASFPAEISEALAMQEGVLLAAEMEVSHAIFESDSLSIIQAISEKLHGGEFGHIIRNIWEVAASFTWCSFKHLKREGNKVAHELARIAKNSGASQVWKWSCPSLVEHLLVEDLCL